jgi:CubicO group peptidase (beta-lactamase class C family)
MVRRDAFDALVTRARREVDAGIVPSCQLALARDGKVEDQVTLGAATAGDESRYVIYSATKPVVASAIWQLLAEGSLRLEDKVADHIPEFAANGKDVVTVEQVLLHTSGFPLAPLGPPAWADRESRVAAFAKWRLNWEPGSRFEYHATSAHWVLAELLARIDGVDHREAIHRRVIEPLGLESLRVGVPLAEQDDVQTVVHTGEPPTEEEFMAVLGIPGIDLGEVTEDALQQFADPANVEAGVPGGGGVSTAGDLALFYQALLHDPEGIWDPVWRQRGTAEIRNTFLDPMRNVPVNRTIGLVVRGDDAGAGLRGFGHGASEVTFGHDGAGGQRAWADPESGLSFVYLTNGIDRHLIREARRGVALCSLAAACA